MNRLSSETSPYLLQHANNPVHWYPWGEEALNLAKKENKPILLSIGYSACHWCHVMAHESFEDDETAEIMNQHYINIKIDREERPDLDKIYQTAHSILTERAGGWPLTVFIDPNDHLPIFAGTYFPKLPRGGMPTFSNVLLGIQDSWLNRQEDIKQQSNSLKDVYKRIAAQDTQSDVALNAIPLDTARKQSEQQFDSKHGGYSSAPKFPHPAIIERALLFWAKTKSNLNPDPRILHTALFSLEKMCSGGIFDHLGGGFCRYSTDEKWMIPHFEKMLYDNGPLLWLNTQAWCLTKNPVYLEAVTETADWVMREMQSPNGGYYSALDADSEGVEGKFFIWTPDEIKHLLKPEHYEIFEQRFGLNKPANFEGHWHLHAYQPYNALSEQHDIAIETLREQLSNDRLQLFNAREKRIHPGLDDKILTSWNALMIKGLAHAGLKLGHEHYIVSATKATQFLKDNCWKNGALLATHKDGKSHLNAYLDDYAFLLSALIELLQSQWDNELLDWATQIADALIEKFEDTETGGFYFTSHDHETLIQRSKTYNDEAIPSGNGVATLSLIQLGYLLSEPRYIDAAERCLKAAWSSLSHAAISHCSMLNALDAFLNPPNILIIRSHTQDNQPWRDSLRNKYLPFTLVFDIPTNIEPHKNLADKTAAETTLAYPCRGYQCQKPLNTDEQLQAFIENNSYATLE